MSFTQLPQFANAIVSGLLVTLMLCAIASVVGIVAGTLLAVVERFLGRWASFVISCYVELFRNTPLLLQLMWIHFSLPMLTGISTTPRVSAVIGLSAMSVAISIEVIRAGLMSVPRGQWEAADALGLHKVNSLRLVILPQALKNIMPAITNMVLSLLRGTTVASILSVGELVQVASRISNYTFRPVEIYTFIVIVYLALGYVIYRAGKFSEKLLANREKP